MPTLPGMPALPSLPARYCTLGEADHEGRVTSPDGDHPRSTLRAGVDRAVADPRETPWTLGRRSQEDLPAARHSDARPRLLGEGRARQDRQGVPLPPAPARTPDVVVVGTWKVEEANDLRHANIVDLWLDREHAPAFQIVPPTAGVWRHPLSLKTEMVLRKTKPVGGGWLVAPPGCLAVRVSPAVLPRALAIMDAVVTACEARGWPVTTEFRMPRRLGWNGTFWFPGSTWLAALPQQPKTLTGVGLLKNHVWFSIREVSRVGPPTPEEIRAYHRQFRWGGRPAAATGTKRRLAL
jgi:hypothetical protein